MKALVKVLAVGLIAAGVGVVGGRMLAPQPKPIPAEPLGRLKYGNELFAKGVFQSPKVDEMTRYKLETEGQKPLAIVVSCSDSRVPPELIFNQGLGDLFVVRTAGHVVNPENLASIEYAVEHLKAPLIVVLGHTHCGAVKAAVSGKQLEGHMPQLLAHIEPVVRHLHATHPHLKDDALLNRVIQEHVRHTVQTILERSEVVRKYHKMGKVELAGGVYDLRAGAIEWLKLPEGLEGKPHTEKH
ncbi:MAG: carbonic anhydrase [Fimbriimonadales bacterium]|nr:carbonic anhydrase [Fimbriimonadales bacterium]